MMTFNRSMFAGARLPFEVDVSNCAVDTWESGAYIGANAVIQPTSGNETGWQYQNGALPGQTGPAEPLWPLSAGLSIIDGSVDWTAVQPPSVAGDTIASVIWVQLAPPDGNLTVNGQTNTTLTASAYLGGGTKGMTYTVEAQITMVSGAIYIAQIILTVN